MKHKIVLMVSGLLLAGTLVFSYQGNIIQKIKSEIYQTSITKPITICLQPFNGFPNSSTELVAKEIKKHYPHVTILKPIPLPQSAYYAPRNRYRADRLIAFLSKQTQLGQHTIGLTTKDISTTHRGQEDWGVMGLGYKPGNACVVSTFRLKGNNKLEKLYKLSFHEIGHTLGIPHCPEPTCFMRDAEGKDHFNEETGFCKSCKREMQNAGWTLNK